MYNGFIVDEGMRNRKRYNGTTEKFGITVNGVNYIVKFMKRNETELFSEYIASRFINSLNINCHQVWLGWYREEAGKQEVLKKIVILKDFTTDEIKLRPYENTEQSSEDTNISNKIYTYEDTSDMIKKHTKMSDTEKEKALLQFWEMYVCDAILGNRDRHSGNWGYLTDGNKYTAAPIYDNGGSLFPDVWKVIKQFPQNPYKFISERAEQFPASVFMKERPDGSIKRTNYYEVLGDLRISHTLAKVVRIIKSSIGFEGIFQRILSVLKSVPSQAIPQEYKYFYMIIICVRYLHIVERKSIRASYNQTVEQMQRHNIIKQHDTIFTKIEGGNNNVKN